MRNELNDAGEGPVQQRPSPEGAGADGGNDALKTLDHLFGPGEGSGPQEPVAPDGPDHEAPPSAGKSDADGQEGDRGGPPQPKQAADAGRSGSVDDGAQTVARRNPATAGSAGSEPGAEAGHEGGDGSPAGNGVEPGDRGSGRPDPQFEIVHPDDPGFLDEFGAVKDGEQGIFDWFALETRDPLDVEDDMFSEAADLPNKLAEEEAGSRSSADVAAERRGNRPDAMGRRSRLERSESDAVRHGGNGSASPGDADGALVGNSRAAAGSGTETNPAAKVPDDRTAGDGVAARESGGALNFRRWSTGWPRKGLAVVALAVVGGVAFMQLGGDAGFRRALESAVSGTTGSDFGTVPASLPADPLLPRSLAEEGRTVDDGGSVVQAAGRLRNPVPVPAEPVVPGDDGRFRLQLVPVGLDAAGPLAVDASETAEWDRLFSLLGQPIGGLSANVLSGTGPFEAFEPDSRQEIAGSGGSARPHTEFTADDGFGFAASDASVRPEAPDGKVEFLGPDLPPASAADDGGTPSGMTAGPVPELGSAESAADRDAGAATGTTDLAKRVAEIEGRLAAVNREVDELRTRIGVAILRRPGALSLSQFVAPEGLAEGLEADAGSRDAVYVIRSGKDESAPTAALADIRVGDRVDGFGEVLDIAEYGDGGRLLVMEEGSVYLN